MPKPVSRFQLGRQAVHAAKKATELSDFAKDLLTNEIGYLPTVENVPSTDVVFQNYESRKEGYGKLWKALVTDDTSPILGIYGMPGVGKTTMMEQLWGEAKEKKIFDKVVRVDVGSEKLDIIKLQNQVAGQLGCNLKSLYNMKERATQLENSLLNQGKILLILDDVWCYIPLDDILGTPFVAGSKSKGSKILLTSRERYVCLYNNCKRPIEITILTPDEAWYMFRNTVGNGTIESLSDESLVQELCNKCSGLPLLIHAVSKALIYRPLNIWRDALYQLDRGKFERIAGIDPLVYACVKLSIDRLEDDAKSCLFLCSLFSDKDADINIGKLVQLATCTQLVPDGESRTCAMVDIIRSSSLLLGSQDHIIKLHDLIRDVARSIAIKDPKYVFLLVRRGSRLPDNAIYCTRRLLQWNMEKNDFRFPVGLVCPDLHSLWLKTHLLHFSGDFFEKLETLCIWNCYHPLPLNLQNLKHLTKLEIQGTGGTMVQMVPYTLSSMPSLEQLHIPGGFEIRGVGYQINSGHTSVPMLMEISKLTNLKSLQMLFKSSERLQDTPIFDNLVDFNLYMGDTLEYSRYLLDSSVSTKRSIEFEVYDNHSDLKGLKGLISRAEEVKLNVTDISVDNIYNSNREAFTDLRKLYIQNCDNVEYLTGISHGEIQHRRSFSKLNILEIVNCRVMKYLFSKSAAKCLVQLQKLSIKYCPEMEAVITNEGISDGADDDIINFSKLKSLSLKLLPRLKSFYMQKKDMHSGSTTDKYVISRAQAPALFDEKVAFPYLEDLKLRSAGETARKIWGNHHSNNIVYSSSFCKLRHLWLGGFFFLDTVIPLAMVYRLQNLEHLEIYNCYGLRNVFEHSSIGKHLIYLKTLLVERFEMMTEIFGGDDDDAIIALPELITLHLHCLRNLSSFWCYQSGEADTFKVQFPNLVDFNISRCGEIDFEVTKLGEDDFSRH